jgi:hypothetical protein
MKEEDKKPAGTKGRTDANRDPITEEPGAHPVGTGWERQVGRRRGPLLVRWGDRSARQLD